MSSGAVVQVWRVDLAGGNRDPEEMRSLLARPELARLRRLRDDELARRWLVSRVALREILARELRTSAAGVPLVTGPHGRPALDGGLAREELDFNLSHSGELAVVALGRRVRVGIDIECQRPGRDPLRVARRYFAEPEVAAITALPEAERPAAFLRYWTAKEALAKGLGLGLRIGLGELEVSQRPGYLAPLRLAREWRIIELAGLPRGYHGALAVDREPARFAVRDWPPARGWSPTSSS